MATASAYDFLEVELVKQGERSPFDTQFLVMQDVQKWPGDFVNFLSKVAADHSEQELLNLTYQDEDGDWCTLNEATTADALNFIENREKQCPKLKVAAAFKQAEPKSQVFAPPPREPAAEPPAVAAAPPASSSSAETPNSFMTGVLKEVNSLSCGMDFRRLLPVLAGAALRVIENAQEPALFPLLDLVVAVRDGHIKADNWLSVLPQVFEVLESMSLERRMHLFMQMKAEAKKAVEELRNSEDVHQQQQPVVEIHAHVTCDGCGMTPIAGHRYKHLLHDDFDYCKACFMGKTDQNPNEWARVRSDVTGEVVSSYYAPAGNPNAHHGITCDSCDANPVMGKRFRCLDRDDYDLCEACHTRLSCTPEFNGVRFEVLAKLVPNSDAAFRAMDESARLAEVTAEDTGDQNHTDAVDAVETLTATQAKDALTALLKHQEQSVRCAAAGVVKKLTLSVEVADEQAMVEPSEELATGTAPKPAVEEIPQTAIAESVPATHSMPVASARVIHSSPLMLGIEAQEDTSGRGDITEEFGAAIRASGGTQGYRVGRIAVPINGTTAVPACAKIVVQNDGEVTWPEATIMAHVTGDHFGFPQLPLGPLRLGEVAEVVMDLLVPPKTTSGSTRSTWTIVDASNGKVLGPILLFEVVWMAC
eukprot:TRINITY_DN18608_c0_g1_i6.p1 TRINITY_DN18608_c0_g1~~TRINITY_DN18608_c0_g1_i6.p1  ORF type:complete len:673 (+),score=136.35 TRINITY_DN18608_c0_g1_i6:79-2019(+)